MYVAVIVASIYLFPLEWYAFLKRALIYLEQRQLQREREAVRQAWIDWLIIAHHSLKHTKSVRQQIRILKEARAAGERFLNTAGASDEPKLYSLSEKVYLDLADRIQTLVRSKKRDGVVTPAPDA